MPRAPPPASMDPCGNQTPRPSRTAIPRYSLGSCCYHASRCHCRAPQPPPLSHSLPHRAPRCHQHRSSGASPSPDAPWSSANRQPTQSRQTPRPSTKSHPCHQTWPRRHQMSSALPRQTPRAIQRASCRQRVDAYQCLPSPHLSRQALEPPQAVP